MCITLHFSVLNLSFQVLDDVLRESMSCWRVTLSVTFLILHQSFMSSANILMSFIIQVGNSFTNSKNSNSPNTLPYGTPLNTSCSSENAPRMPTFIVLDTRISSSHTNNLPLIPYPFNFSSSLRCGTLSNAFR